MKRNQLFLVLLLIFVVLVSFMPLAKPTIEGTTWLAVDVYPHWLGDSACITIGNQTVADGAVLTLPSDTPLFLEVSKECLEKYDVKWQSWIGNGITLAMDHNPTFLNVTGLYATLTLTLAPKADRIPTVMIRTVTTTVMLCTLRETFYQTVTAWMARTTVYVIAGYVANTVTTSQTVTQPGTNQTVTVTATSSSGMTVSTVTVASSSSLTGSFTAISGTRVRATVSNSTGGAP